jgi:hypothetical protein
MAPQIQGLKIEYPQQLNIQLAALFLNMSEGRLRSLCRENKVPFTREDGDTGAFIFQLAELQKFAAEPKTRAAGTGTRKEGPAGKAFMIHVTADKLQAVKKALGDVGIELEPRYDTAKQHAYQAKRKAEKAAAKAANAANPQAPKPVVAPAVPGAPVPATAKPVVPPTPSK